MTMQQADWTDVLAITRETFDLWSPGLTREEYRYYIRRQLDHSWARQHFRYVCVRDGNSLDGPVAASCKLYEHNFFSRGEEYRLLGVGSVYTQKRHRGLGFGKQLVQELIDSADELQFDGVLLFSEIGPEYYEPFGFEEMGATEFIAYTHPSISAENQVVRQSAPVPVEKKHIPDMIRIFHRWRARQPFTFDRDESYLDYKLWRENFLAAHSHLAWPRLNVLFIQSPRTGEPNAYALFEKGGFTMRILEMVGPIERQEELWLELFSWAKRLGIRRIRGWEGQLSALAPSYELKNLLPSFLLDGWVEGPLNFAERDWGRPMLLPLNDDLNGWFDFFPCPLLELDHL